MSLDAAQIASEKRHADTVGVAGTLLINTRRCPARIYTEKGMKFEREGGAVQARKLTAVILCSALPSAEIFTATGDTRSIQLTHIETGLTYRVDTNGIDRSPHGIYWLLECSQPTAMP